MAEQPLSEPAPDANPVDVVIEDERWQGAGLEALAARAAVATLRHLGLQDAEGGAPEIVVMGCDDARIAALNADFRGKPTPTNVLSWPSAEPAPRAPGAVPAPPDDDELGDIAISYDTCHREAAAQGKPLADHATHLLVHAILHLAGYDHENDPDAETMESAERAILASLGISDPYREH